MDSDESFLVMVGGIISYVLFSDILSAYIADMPMQNRWAILIGIVAVLFIIVFGGSD